MRVYSRLLEIIIEGNASQENREYLFPGKFLSFSWREIQNAFSVCDAACGAGDGAAPPGPDLLALLSRRRRPLLQPPLLVQEVLGAHLGTEKYIQ